MPSRNELDELLEHFPTFIDMEPLASNMSKIFPTTQQILVDVIGDPKQNFIAWVQYGTSNETIEAIMRLKKYLIM